MRVNTEQVRIPILTKLGLGCLITALLANIASVWDDRFSYVTAAGMALAFVFSYIKIILDWMKKGK